MANSFAHVEILCRDLGKSKGFYESVFGWRFEQGQPGERFVVIDTGGSISGDLQEVSAGKPVGVTVFISWRSPKPQSDGPPTPSIARRCHLRHR